MFYRLFLFLALGFLIYGCANDVSPVTSEEEGIVEKDVNPFLQGKAVTKTLKVRGSGISTPSEINDCGVYPVLKFIAKGEGHATHLGKFTVELTYCFDVSTFEVVSDIYAVQTTARGDKLYSICRLENIEPVPGTFDNYQPYEYYKGTGIFEGVTGNIVLYVKNDMETGTWTTEGEGEITY